MEMAFEGTKPPHCTPIPGMLDPGKPMQRPALATLVLAACSVFPAAALEYKKDVMPIFDAKCADCHSAKSEKVKGGLRLDDPEGFLKRFAKNDAVIPGDWDASYLFVTITKPHHQKGAMPPKDKGDPLTPGEVMTVAKWIHEGAAVGREKGDKGDPDLDPEKILRFKNGVLITEGDDEDEIPMAPPSAPAAPAGPQEWTNANGQKIKATFKTLKSGHVHFTLENGKEAVYPLDKLSPGSQAAIRKLAGEM
jgi:hypothetical protein